MTIVAISREMRSGGYEIGAAVAKTLHFEYEDPQILLQAAHATARGGDTRGGGGGPSLPLGAL